MRYAPRHAITTSSRKARWATTGLATAALTVGGGIAASGTANAAGGGDVWDRVAACESGGNWGISTGNGYYGGLQFTQSTWRANGGSGSPNGASKSEQIRVAKNVLRTQGAGAWPVCGRKAGLSSSNGGASSGTADTSSRASRSEQRTAVRAQSVEITTVTPRGHKKHVRQVVSVPTKRVAKGHAPAGHAPKGHVAHKAGAGYPGAGAFVLGHRNPAVTLLGERLEAKGFGHFYEVGPGPKFTQADKAAVAAFQRSLGWHGKDVSGYPGPATWAALMAR